MNIEENILIIDEIEIKTHVDQIQILNHQQN
jgi:hypothetical protein